MRFRNIQYFLKEGFRSFWVNGLMSAASAIIVTASLIIFGIYIIFTLNVNFLGDQLLSQYEIQLFLDEGCSPERAQAIGEELKQIAHVKEVQYSPKDQELADYKEKLGDSAGMLDGLENDNPLPDSYRLTLDNLDNSEAVIQQASQIENVKDVRNNKETMDKIVKATNIFKHGSLWLMILLSVISVFIISNTIKITVFARRRDINIMKYLGATDWFISWPFVIEGIIIGLIGAAVSLLIVTQSYMYIIGSLSPTFLGATLRLYKLHEIIWYLVAWFAGIGIVLGALGSAISIRRHLHV